jgi:hypothetical protein
MAAGHTAGLLAVQARSRSRRPLTIGERSSVILLAGPRPCLASAHSSLARHWPGARWTP